MDQGPAGAAPRGEQAPAIGFPIAMLKGVDDVTTLTVLRVTLDRNAMAG